ncbi:MAG: ATPase [Alphaproteobacteria bacterium]|nr:ATPase [Alphaproteobacteria bacterium]
MQIDWPTLALQAINVLVLAWILARFFYRPVAAVIERRRAEARKMLTEADAAKAEAQKAKAELDAARRNIAAERDATLAEARKEAEAARSALLEEARAAAEKKIAEGESEWRRRRADLEGALDQKAAELAVDIARRLLERLPPETANEAFVASLCNELQALSDKTRSLIAAAAARGLTFEIVSASPLDESQERRCIDCLAKAAGRTVTVAFNTDSTLIAGLELRGPEIVIADNWRCDLKIVLEKLKPSTEVYAAS